MARVVLSTFPMIDPETYREVLGEAVDEPVEIEVAELGSTETLIAAADGADAVVTDINTPVTAEALDALDLRVVVRSAVGVDNVDVGAAAANDVTVTRVPDYCTDEVATHTVALLLACARSLGRYDRSVADGEWDFRAGGEIHRLRGSTLGFLSFGPIARRMREQVRGFDLDVVAHDPYVDTETLADHDVEGVSYEELLDRSALLSVNAPLTEETRGMVDSDALGRLPDHAIVVNTGRGGVVDEDALLAALEDGEIAGAGLDVFGEEPPTDSPLLDRDDVLNSPHAAWYSVEARRDLNESVAANLRAVLVDGETPPDWIDPDLDWV